MMAGKHNTGLGRGLDELFGSDDHPIAHGPVNKLDINCIEPNHEQPRKLFDEERLSELADSIRLHGVITPLTVRKIDGGRYKIVAGERRYRAARMAGLTELPVVILDVDELEAMEMALVENLQREDLNPIEEAEGFRSLIERYGMTQEDAAERVGRSRSAIANSLRLLELPPEIKDHAISGRLSAGHCRALLALSDSKTQISVANRVISLELSVRQTEALVKRMKSDGKKQRSEDEVDYTEELSKKLSSQLGRGVKISVNSKNKGKLILDFYDLDDLDGLLRFFDK